MGRETLINAAMVFVGNRLSAATAAATDQSSGFILVNRAYGRNQSRLVFAGRAEHMANHMDVVRIAPPAEPRPQQTESIR